MFILVIVYIVGFSKTHGQFFKFLILTVSYVFAFTLYIDNIE